MSECFLDLQNQRMIDRKKKKPTKLKLYNKQFIKLDNSNWEKSSLEEALCSMLITLREIKSVK